MRALRSSGRSLNLARVAREDFDRRARELGLALLDASRIYETFVIPRFEGRLRKRPFPRHRAAIISLAARQRRFLASAYALADAGLDIEAVGPLRSMYEFLICQRWLARDPGRNWRLWMEQDHASRDLWRTRLRQNAPALHEAAASELTPEQIREAEAVAVARGRVKQEIGEALPDDRYRIEHRAEQVGMKFVYDTVYRYQSSLLHPTMFATEVLLERVPEGLRLRRDPSPQFARPTIYLDAAVLLRDALLESGRETPALRLKDLLVLSDKLRALASAATEAQTPNWEDFLPSDPMGT